MTALRTHFLHEISKNLYGRAAVRNKFIVKCHIMKSSNCVSHRSTCFPSKAGCTILLASGIFEINWIAK